MDAEAELAAHAARRAQILQRVRTGVEVGNLDLDVSNAMLEALGLPPLPQCFTTDVSVDLTVTVIARSRDEAVRLAEAAVVAVLEQTRFLDRFDVHTRASIRAGVAPDRDTTAGLAGRAAAQDHGGAEPE
ncbi:hypothetical protein ACFPIJ_56515 [Dactylosporangium cerinum]|uniref:Uncharacterized protein n=1 Tax=Dactylosporangium cerinum TaxID=1434730 RepID=A0ABV9WEN8_9ACTN